MHTVYGLTENEFKVRCSNHKTAFRDKNRNQTTLSSYIWKLKDREIPYVVDWSIKARGHPFSSGGRACDLCLTEKLIILTADQNSMLNKRDELLETCRHRRKHLLVSLGTIHLRRWHALGGEGSKICQICRRIVLKNCRR